MICGKKAALLLLLLLGLTGCFEESPQFEQTSSEIAREILSDENDPQPEESNNGSEETEAPPVEEEPSAEEEPSVEETPEVVNDCDNLGEPGTVIDVKQNAVPELVHSLAVDPKQHGVLYIGTHFEGLWKSEDCGAHWQKLTGNEHINSGKVWGLAIDHTASSTIYASIGEVGAINPLYKSENGGENWKVAWPPEGEEEYWSLRATGFLYSNNITIDPDNSQHLVLTFHNECNKSVTRSYMCFAESFDGGDSWRLVDGKANWPGSGNYISNQIHILDDDTWVLTTYGYSNSLGVQLMQGMAKYPDEDYTATKIPGLDGIHYQGSQLLHSSISNTYFLPTHNGIAKSVSGAANDWQIIPDTGAVVAGIIETGDGTLYSSHPMFPNYFDNPGLIKSTNLGQSWQSVNLSPYNDLTRGAHLGYDPEHKLLYINTENRLLRIKIE